MNIERYLIALRWCWNYLYCRWWSQRTLWAGALYFPQWQVAWSAAGVILEVERSMQRYSPDERAEMATVIAKSAQELKDALPHTPVPTVIRKAFKKGELDI